MSASLAEAIARHTGRERGQNPFRTAIPGFVLLRSDHAKPPTHLIYRPALCIIAQGAKSTTFGGNRLDFHAGQALVVSVEIPSSGRITEASPDKPFLGAVVEFDLAIMRDVLSGLETPPHPAAAAGCAVYVTDFAGPLSDCVARMVRLLETPQAIPTLYPAVMRELCYWLLSGPHGGDIARMTLAGDHGPRIVKAIHHLRRHYAAPVRVDELAGIAQLSASAFHRQFKALTWMTPLQYQKQLRLLEARRLMVEGAANVETATFQVGYESASQFSREYSRMFGVAPLRDIAALRRLAA